MAEGGEGTEHPVLSRLASRDMAMVRKKKRRKCSDVAVKQGIQGRGKPAAAGVDNYLVG